MKNFRVFPRRSETTWPEFVIRECASSEESICSGKTKCNESDGKQRAGLSPLIEDYPCTKHDYKRCACEQPRNDSRRHRFSV